MSWLVWLAVGAVVMLAVSGVFWWLEDCGIWPAGHR